MPARATPHGHAAPDGKMPFVLDPRQIGVIDGDPVATAGYLRDVHVDFDAIADESNRLHELAAAELAKREALLQQPAGADGSKPLPQWALSVPDVLRDPAASDDDRANYIGMTIAIDYRHWIAGPLGHIPLEATAESVSDHAPPGLRPFEKTVPLQFWHRTTPSPRDVAAQQTAVKEEDRWVRGSQSMMHSLREAVERADSPFHWYRPDVLTNPVKWSVDTAASIMTYKVQPPNAPAPRSSAEAAMAAAGWPEAPIPALPERVEMLREIATTLIRHKASYLDIAKVSHRRLFNNGYGFIERLLVLHRRYDDHAILPGADGAVHKVNLLKLAQLTAIALHDARCIFSDPTVFEFTDWDQLQVAPDYQLPKALRNAGCLRYSARLAALVDGHELIPAGSREEAELRIATVAAARALYEALRKRYGDARVDVSLVDFVLWLAGREATAQAHHLTITDKY